MRTLRGYASCNYTIPFSEVSASSPALQTPGEDKYSMDVMAVPRSLCEHYSPCVLRTFVAVWGFALYGTRVALTGKLREARKMLLIRLNSWLTVVLFNHTVPFAHSENDLESLFSGSYLLHALSGPERLNSRA